MKNNIFKVIIVFILTFVMVYLCMTLCTYGSLLLEASPLKYFIESLKYEMFLKSTVSIVGGLLTSIAFLLVANKNR